MFWLFELFSYLNILWSQLVRISDFLLYYYEPLNTYNYAIGSSKLYISDLQPVIFYFISLGHLEDQFGIQENSWQQEVHIYILYVR